jgi:hypothetical protein
MQHLSRPHFERFLRFGVEAGGGLLFQSRVTRYFQFPISLHRGDKSITPTCLGACLPHHISTRLPLPSQVAARLPSPTSIFNPPPPPPPSRILWTGIRPTPHLFFSASVSAFDSRDSPSRSAVRAITTRRVVCVDTYLKPNVAYGQ